MRRSKKYISGRRILLTSCQFFVSSVLKKKYVMYVVFLIAFLLMVLTGLKANIVANWEKTSCRLNGSNAVVEVSRASKKQVSYLQNQVSQVKQAGVFYSFCNYKKYTCCYADSTCWNKIVSPAMGEVRGRYPLKEDEILVPQGLLKENKMQKKTLGDYIKLKNQFGQSSFKIVGTFVDYGTKEHSKNIYFSKEYAKKMGGITTKNCNVLLTSEFVNYYLADAIMEDNQITKTQIKYTDTQRADRSNIIAILNYILLVIFLFGIITLYYILDTSLAWEQKDYALLTVIGTTPAQLMHCFVYQGILTALPGILLGTVAGTMSQIAFVPVIMQAGLAGNGSLGKMQPGIAENESIGEALVTGGRFVPYAPILAAGIITAMTVAGYLVRFYFIRKQSLMEQVVAASGARVKSVKGHGSRLWLKHLANYFHRSGRGHSFLLYGGLWLGINITAGLFALGVTETSGNSNTLFASQINCIRLLGVLCGGILFLIMLLCLYSYEKMQAVWKQKEYLQLWRIGMTGKQRKKLQKREQLLEYAAILKTFCVLEIPLAIVVFTGVKSFSTKISFSWGVFMLAIVVMNVLIYKICGYTDTKTYDKIGEN